MAQNRIIPIYTTRGDAEAFLCYPHLYNRNGEWIGFVTIEKQVYSVHGAYVGELTSEPRILRKRIVTASFSRKTPPTHPIRLLVPATVPLAPLMGELRFGMMDVLLEEPELLHTLDAGELRQDMDY